MPVAVAAPGGRHMCKIKVISCLLNISSEKLEAWNGEITAKINFGTTFTVKNAALCLLTKSQINSLVN